MRCGLEAKAKHFFLKKSLRILLSERKMGNEIAGESERESRGSEFQSI